MIIPPGFGVGSYVFQLQGGGREMVTTFGLELQGTDFGENRVATLSDLYDTHLRTEMSSAVRLVRTELKYGPRATGPTFVDTREWVGPGAGPLSPPNVTYLARKSTALGGRPNRGRMYFPAVPEANVDNAGVVAVGTVTNMTTKLRAWRAALATNNMPMVILHSASSDPTTVTDLVLDSRVATQRRRLR